MFRYFLFLFRHCGLDIKVVKVINEIKVVFLPVSNVQSLNTTLGSVGALVA